MSIQNIVDVALPALGHAQTWYSALSNSDTDRTNALLNDAQRFTLEFFEPIKEGSGQNYYSALLLSPPCALTHTYKSEIMPGIIFVKGGQRAWGPCLRSMHGHKRLIKSISCSPDGKSIASGSCDQTIRVWDAVSGSTLATLTGHTQYINSTNFSPDGEKIISASDDGTIRVWEHTTDVNFHILKGHAASVCAATFSRDSAYLLSASRDGTVRVWSSETGEVLSTLQGDNPFLDAEFDPAAQTVVVGDGGGRLALWDWHHDVASSDIYHHADVVTKVHFNHDGTRIVSCSHDKTAKVFTRSGEVLCILQCQGSATQFYNALFSEDGTHLWTSDHFMRLWNITTGEMVASFNTQGGAIKALAFFPGQKRVAFGMMDYSIRIWDIDLATNISPLADDHKEGVTCFALSKNSQYLVSSSYDGTARVWNTDSGVLVTALNHPLGSHVVCVCVDIDGSRIASAADKSIYIWNAEGTHLATLEGHTSSVLTVAFSPTQNHIASGAGGYDNSVCIWNIRDQTVSWMVNFDLCRITGGSMNTW
ncbi:quinon protein alcohol dehydrogenase-like superfamily [Lentinula aciculospora]|uniref:Quinon protein alcohol dehydrogenase-like superfamily n=1 Tax=Lentinula aciculospora TaxID=153920 RepID=A0A9W9A5N2_9AGAR|nr:quinon protein alcohol dehydrogenase-like superfamily [Lentinula aciculospora]